MREVEAITEKVGSGWWGSLLPVSVTETTDASKLTDYAHNL